MLAITIILYVISLASEAAGLVLLIREANTAQKSLRRWVAANPKGNEAGSYGQTLELNGIMLGLLGNPRTRQIVVSLVAVGLVAGASGNFVSLTL